MIAWFQNNCSSRRFHHGKQTYKDHCIHYRRICQSCLLGFLEDFLRKQWIFHDSTTLATQGCSCSRFEKPAPGCCAAAVKLSEVLEHYSTIVQSLPEKPIIIGH